MQEIDWKATSRALAFEQWIDSPAPMAMITRTIDVTKLVKYHRIDGFKFNLLLCYCIGKAASQTPDFSLLPVDGVLMKFDQLGVSTVVKTKNGGINTCEIPFSYEFQKFNRDYQAMTAQVYEFSDVSRLEDSYMVVGTSALAEFDVDAAFYPCNGKSNAPFLMWGRYRKKFRKYVLPVSFRFHPIQLDGIPAALFLETLQDEIRNLKI